MVMKAERERGAGGGDDEGRKIKRGTDRERGDGVVGKERETWRETGREGEIGRQIEIGRETHREKKPADSIAEDPRNSQKQGGREREREGSFSYCAGMRYSEFQTNRAGF